MVNLVNGPNGDASLARLAKKKKKEKNENRKSVKPPQTLTLPCRYRGTIDARAHYQHRSPTFHTPSR